MTKSALFIGLTTIDIQYFVGEYPTANKKVKTDPPDILVGGPATNAAVAFSYLKGKACLSSAVGVNPFSSLIGDDLRKTNVQFVDMVGGQNYQAIIASVITSDNGDRTIFTHNPENVDPSITAGELFENADPEILLLDGFYPEFAVACAKLANKKNIPVVIDGGSWKPQYADILKYTDMAICSEEFMPPACSSTEDVFLFFKNRGVENVAISRGAKSILYEQNGFFGEIKAESVLVKDTLGAGDFLHGAFCFFYLETGNFAEALGKASKIATKSCTYAGTRSWLKY